MTAVPFNMFNSCGVLDPPPLTPGPKSYVQYVQPLLDTILNMIADIEHIEHEIWGQGLEGWDPRTMRA
eukprot:4077849-Amphidinium_carterae.1